MIVVDTTQAVRELTDTLGALTRRQIPFAAALALTRTVQDAQEREVHEMRDVFNRPTPYTLSGVYIKPATKQSLEATVGLKSMTGKGIPATKFLAAQIGGGARRMKRFEIALRRAGHLPEDFRVVPGSGAKLDAYGNIAPSQIVQILSYLRAFPEAGYKANMSDRRKRQLARGTRSKQGFTYFIGRAGSRGPLGVWQRFGFARGSAVRPVLIFVRQARYQAAFDFEHVAVTTAHRSFFGHFKSALGTALSTAR